MFQKSASADWSAKERSEKVTSDAGVVAVERRDVRAVLKNLDVTWKKNRRNAHQQTGSRE